MIRDKDKVYGELNHEDTVLTDNILSDNKFVVGTSTNKVETRSLGAKRILHSGQDGNLKATTHNAPTKYIGTDASNNLVLYNRIVIPTTVPTRRELVIELKGSENAADVITQSNILLTAPFFYEVEVLGADGGGGAGIVRRSGYGEGFANYDSSHGGVGGYYKDIHLVESPVTAILQPGNSGEGAKGFIVSGSGKSKKITGSRRGGRGGRSFEKYERVMTFDIDGKSGGKFGGIGQNNGANGGSVQKVKWDDEIKAAGGGGGGANGPYGGDGGSIWYDQNGDIPTATPGGAGGAGGGFGEAGRGGGGNEADLGPDGYGGGGGGDGYSLALVGSGDTEVKPASSGGGGGGGGGSRLVIGELEILAGGGGGGAGGTHNHSDITMSCSNGANGRNNMNSQTNPTKQRGGAGGTGLHEDDAPTGNTAGGNGDPGVIRIWRCIP